MHIIQGQEETSTKIEKEVHMQVRVCMFRKFQ